MPGRIECYPLKFVKTTRIYQGIVVDPPLEIKKVLYFSIIQGKRIEKAQFRPKTEHPKIDLR